MLQNKNVSTKLQRGFGKRGKANKISSAEMKCLKDISGNASLRVSQASKNNAIQSLASLWRSVRSSLHTRPTVYKQKYDAS